MRGTKIFWEHVYSRKHRITESSSGELVCRHQRHPHSSAPSKRVTSLTRTNCLSPQTQLRGCAICWAPALVCVGGDGLREQLNRPWLTSRVGVMRRGPLLPHGHSCRVTEHVSIRGFQCQSSGPVRDGVGSELQSKWFQGLMKNLIMAFYDSQICHSLTHNLKDKPMYLCTKFQGDPSKI